MKIKISFYTILVIYFFLGIENSQAPRANVEKREKRIFVPSKKKGKVFLEREYKKITRIWDLGKKNSQEVHHTPKEFLLIGKILSKIDDFLRKKKISLAHGVKFFEKCSLDHEMLYPTKAICLSLLLKYNKKTELKDYSKKILKSAHSVQFLLKDLSMDGGLSQY
jgi:hypothetical protein